MIIWITQPGHRYEWEYTLRNVVRGNETNSPRKGPMWPHKTIPHKEGKTFTTRQDKYSTLPRYRPGWCNMLHGKWKLTTANRWANKETSHPPLPPFPITPGFPHLPSLVLHKPYDTRIGSINLCFVQLFVQLDATSCDKYSHMRIHPSAITVSLH